MTLKRVAGDPKGLGATQIRGQEKLEEIGEEPGQAVAFTGVDLAYDERDHAADQRARDRL